MIEFIALIVLILFFVYLLLLLFSSAIIFIVNLVILILIVPQAINDIKKRDMHIFYLLSAIITAIVFIAEEPLRWLFGFMDRAMILPLFQALIMIFALAHLLALAYFSIKGISKHKKQG